MTKLKKLFIICDITWKDLMYLYGKVLPNNTSLIVTFSSNNHQGALDYLKNVQNCQGKDWTAEFKYFSFLLSDKKPRKREEIFQAVLCNESAQYFISKIALPDDPFVFHSFFVVFSNLRAQQQQGESILIAAAPIKATATDNPTPNNPTSTTTIP